eukprot:4016979-Amphidinium_carterae.2
MGCKIVQARLGVAQSQAGGGSGQESDEDLLALLPKHCMFPSHARPPDKMKFIMNKIVFEDVLTFFPKS